MKKLLIYIIFGFTINSYSQSDFVSILNIEIYDFAIEKDTVWICTGDSLLIKLQTDGTILDSIVLIHDTVDNVLYSIAIDTNGVKWIATEGKGVFSYDGKTLINYTTEDGLAFDFTTSIAVDKQNRIWIGTEGHGISVFDGNKWDTIKVSDDKKEVVYSIKIDSSDTKWISTYFGIYEYKDSVINIYILDSYGYLSNGTLIDSKGNKWFGTSGKGVYKFDGVNWTQYTTSDGLIDNWVLALYEDYQGNIWYGSKMWGISIFNGQNWISIPNSELHDIDITSILVIPVPIKSSNYRRIWIGTKNGLYINENISLSTNNPDSFQYISVYPNPTADYIIIDKQEVNESKYSIFNISGQIIKKGTIPTNGKINLSKLYKGLYILKIDNEVFKIIKQ